MLVILISPSYLFLNSRLVNKEKIEIDPGSRQTNKEKKKVLKRKWLTN